MALNAPGSLFVDPGPGIHNETGPSGELDGHDFEASNVQDGQVTEMYEGAAQKYGPGRSFLSEFDSDQHAQQQKSNMYYPFASKDDWQLASWLLRSGLSMNAIDEFLSL